jgi:hypothetical protein
MENLEFYESVLRKTITSLSEQIRGSQGHSEIAGLTLDYLRELRDLELAPKIGEIEKLREEISVLRDRVVELEKTLAMRQGRPQMINERIGARLG